jgi:hypothetical protein
MLIDDGKERNFYQKQAYGFFANSPVTCRGVHFVARRLRDAAGQSSYR